MILTAPAKLNLFLHITGKRADGYHLLQSLVAFTEFGDTLEIVPDTELSLQVSGEFAGALSDAQDNLVLRAARLLQQQSGCKEGAKITLTKSIPVGAGLGGGSADAAAALHGLASLWNVPLDGAAFSELGSDIAVCLAATPAWVEGVGERVTPVAMHTGAWAVLVNPRLPLATADVYRAFAADFAPDFAMPEFLSSFDALLNYLKPRYNALEMPTAALMPVIEELLAALYDTKDCGLARMSGSGATCFGLYEQEMAARQAAEKIRREHPQWWCIATKLREA